VNTPARTTCCATIQGIHDGGGFGSIIGRNVFQRPKAEALALLDQIITIFKN
jgi:class I fructose-bisphosphate aldolase